MIDVLSAGLFTTIQDRGRYGYRSLGVPLSGAMDMYSADLANSLVRNTNDSAVLECTVTGPVLRFQRESHIAITGALCSPSLDGSEIPMNEIIFINAGSTLTLGRALKGVRMYIAVQGGFNSEKVLGSYSQYSGITSETKLQKGAKLSVTSGFVSDKNNDQIILPRTNLNSLNIEVSRGPEFDKLPKLFQKQLTNSSFKIAAQSNRMAILLNSALRLSTEDIITAPVQPGTVQLTPSGQVIVLMRDAQTTGGYARILQLPEASICSISQKRAGEEIHFIIK